MGPGNAVRLFGWIKLGVRSERVDASRKESGSAHMSRFTSLSNGISAFAVVVGGEHDDS